MAIQNTVERVTVIVIASESESESIISDKPKVLVRILRLG